MTTAMYVPKPKKYELKREIETADEVTVSVRLTACRDNSTGCWMLIDAKLESVFLRLGHHRVAVPVDQSIHGNPFSAAKIQAECESQFWRFENDFEREWERGKEPC